MAKRKKISPKTISCVCETRMKGNFVQTAKNCVCTEINKSPQKDIGFPITLNVVKDSDEWKRQKRERK